MRLRQGLARAALAMGVLSLPGLCLAPGACLCAVSDGARPSRLFLECLALSRVVPGLARLSVLVAFAAVLLGLVALWQIRRRPDLYGGRPLAIDGVLSGAIMLFCGLVLISELSDRRSFVLSELEIQVARYRLHEIHLAERRYSSVNGGHFDAPHCLAAPCRCLPRCDDLPSSFWDEGSEPLASTGDYAFSFHPGPPPPELDAARFSPSSLTGFAVVATPIDPKVGLRSFCVDATGVTCLLPRDQEPAAPAGRCPASCEALR